MMKSLPIKMSELFRRNLELKIYGFIELGDGPFPRQFSHSHGFWQVNMGCSGSSAIEFDGCSRSLNKGDIVVIPPHCEHSLQYGPHSYSGFSFKFELPHIPGESGFGIEIVRGNRETIQVLAAVRNIYEAFFPDELRGKNRQFTISANAVYPQMIEDLLFDILRYYYFVKPSSRHESELLFKIREEIARHGGSPVTVAALASRLGISAGHLRVMTRKLTGKSTKTIIDEERTQIAAHYLRYSTLNVAEIADQMKFSDTIYFNKFFRKFAGMPPSHYRRRYRTEEGI